MCFVRSFPQRETTGNTQESRTARSVRTTRKVSTQEPALSDTRQAHAQRATLRLSIIPSNHFVEDRDMANRRPFVGGNWKMHCTRSSAAGLAREVASGSADMGDVDIAIFPAFVHLDAVAGALCEFPAAPILGAQDAHPAPEGAFTGEVSIPMLRDLGVTAVLTGHSERRHIIGDSLDLICAKTNAVLDADLTCVLCIGETLEEREAGETDAVNERQLRSALEGIGADACDLLVIAYEPVWAIGTGRTASPDDAQRAHAHIRAILCDVLGSTAADALRVIYGGSVKPINAADLLAQPDIDGALVGGASLVAGDFHTICAAAQQCLENA